MGLTRSKRLHCVTQLNGCPAEATARGLLPLYWLHFSGSARPLPAAGARIYFRDFGVPSEVNVDVEQRDARVTGEMQNRVVPILAATR